MIMSDKRDNGTGRYFCLAGWEFSAPGGVRIIAICLASSAFFESTFSVPPRLPTMVLPTPSGQLCLGIS
jgi:hypothetical protein